MAVLCIMCLSLLCPFLFYFPAPVLSFEIDTPQSHGAGASQAFARQKPWILDDPDELQRCLVNAAPLFLSFH